MNDYADWIKELSKRYRRSQVKAAVSVNSEMISFYWSLGRDIVAKDAENSYGSGFYKALSADLKKAIPNAKGFSPTNLKYMKYFFELFSADALPNRPQAVDDLAGTSATLVPAELLSLPWGHIRLLIDKCGGDADKALFYARKSVENNWSRAVLMNFLDTGLFERQGTALSNFATTLPAPQGELAQEITRDPYNFDFLGIRDRYDERELKDALMDNISRFLLELGTGFAFVGREFRIEVGDSERFLDMLFYHIRLRCYVVLEVKVTDFEPSYMGQLGTYVVAVNHNLKTEDDNPTIGLLVCKSLDQVEAQYALESSSQPVGVSGYELSKLIPDDFKSSLPTIEEIEEELRR